MWVILIPNDYDFLLILNSYVCRIRHIIGYGRTIPKWNKPDILLWVWVRQTVDHLGVQQAHEVAVHPLVAAYELIHGRVLRLC